MFPTLDLSLVKKEMDDNKPKENQGITYLYDFKKGDFVLRNGKPVIAEGKDRIRVWIEKILLTEEFVYEIYKKIDSNNEYGTPIRKMVLGKKVPRLLLHSELKRIITEKMKRNIEIERIEDFHIEQEIASLIIYFTVILVNGDSFRQEVSF